MIIIEYSEIHNNKTTLLFLSEDIPDKEWWKVKINGVIYEPLIVYDLKAAVGINAPLECTGEEIEFLDKEDLEREGIK